MNAPAVSPIPVFWKETLRAYNFPLVMFGLAIVPYLNFLYSGHGGFAWMFLPLCGPWVAVRAILKTARGAQESRIWYRHFYKITLPSYFVLALPLSWAATASIHVTFGLEVSPWYFLAIIISPLPWWYFA